MSLIEQVISSLQELVAQVPELARPFIVVLAAAIPFVEGEGGPLIGVVGALPPVVVAAAAATGSFLSVLLVVPIAARARTAVVDRRPSPVGVSGEPPSRLWAALTLLVGVS